MEQELIQEPEEDPAWIAIDELMAQIESLQAQRKHLQHDIDRIDERLKPLAVQLRKLWTAYRKAGGTGPQAP